MKQKKIISLLLGVLAAILFVGCANNIKDGIEYLEEENYQEAIKSFQKDIVEKKNLGEAYRGIGIAQYEMEDFEMATISLEAALEYGTEETATIYNFLGAGYLQMDEYEMALEYYDKALKMEDCTKEMEQEILFNQIAIYQELGDWDILNEKVPAYMEKYPDDDRMDKTAEFLKSREVSVEVEVEKK